MYDANSLGNGATCGINEETKGTFRSGNEATKLENALKGAWKVPEYWNNSHSYIADLKKTVDEFINETFNKSDRISIASIYEMLKAEPYGFMPCNLTAFILGFILKEYTKGVYSYSDNLTTVPLDAEKLASMISEIIKQDNTPEKRYKDKFIVTLTEEERAFNKATSVAFDIPEMYCVSVTETRSRIREQMKGFSFPIWVIKYVLDDKTFKTDKDVVSKLIDNYCGIANNKNMEGEKSDNDIALTIGKLCLDNEGVVDDLKSILTKDNCKSGMLEYLKLYDGGKLPAVAEKINDGGQYINQLQYKFSSDAANWVWNTDTVNAKIDELICEYEIIEISNGVLSKNATYEENKQSFDIYAKGKYQTVLNGDTADSILEKLRNFKEEALNTLVKKVFKVPVVKGSFSMTTGELCDWIREIIEKNNLKELVFIWDEFSEYFENNMHHLTGFQQVAELAATAPFCLLIVTHKAEGYFSDGDPDKRKILDRFVSPIHISLPENIAFELMHEALKVTDDVDKAAKWEKHRKSLEDRTMQSRSAVSKKIGLTDKDLSNVLPIHPYAALILQHISIYYTSTARSMFNFIKNDEGEDVKAFQWFIDRYDFSSQNPFVTIDMLWNFFYETGSQKLADGIREVLSCYTQKMDKELMEDEKRVLKVILLLQAISERMSGNRDIFLPNNKNLTLAFEGTDLEFTAQNIAKKLLNDHVVTRTPLTGDVFSYCCKNMGPSVDPGPFIAQAKGKSTKDMSFMAGSNLRNKSAMLIIAKSLKLHSHKLAVAFKFFGYKYVVI